MYLGILFGVVMLRLSFFFFFFLKWKYTSSVRGKENLHSQEQKKEGNPKLHGKQLFCDRTGTGPGWESRAHWTKGWMDVREGIINGEESK